MNREDQDKWVARARRVGLAIGLGLAILICVALGLLVGTGLWLAQEGSPVSGLLLIIAGLFGLVWFNWRCKQ